MHLVYAPICLDVNCYRGAVSPIYNRSLTEYLPQRRRGNELGNELHAIYSRIWVCIACFRHSFPCCSVVINCDMHINYLHVMLATRKKQFKMNVQRMYNIFQCITYNLYFLQAGRPLPSEALPNLFCLDNKVFTVKAIYYTRLVD